MSPNEEQLLRGLKALAAEETAMPPKALEAALLKRLKRRRWFSWPLALETLAAAVILAIALFSQRKEPAEASNFIPVPYAAPLGPNERAALVQVNVPVSALAQWGLQVSPLNSNQRVDADVVIGEDGLARAIRFTNSQ